MISRPGLAAVKVLTLFAMSGKRYDDWSFR
jgi:hypothetical protein